MGKEIKILTDLTHLIPGETVTVPIVLELESSTKLRCITAKFHATERTKADYTVTRTDSKGRSRSETKTATQYHDIVKNEFTFVGEPTVGCFASIGEFFASLVGAGKGTFMAPGRHEYLAEFSIPEHAPASLDGKKCDIYYELSARVDLPLKTDFTAKHFFEVLGPDQILEGKPVVAYYPDEKGRGFWQKTFGKDAKLTLALQNDAYAPGDTVVGLFQAETISPIKVNSIKAQLICRESTRADGHSDRYTHKGESVIIAEAQEIHGGFSTEFQLTADLFGPVTAHATNFDVDWFVLVTMDVPWAIDPVIQAPIRMTKLAE